MSNTPVVTEKPFVVCSGDAFTVLALARVKTYRTGGVYGPPQHFPEVRLFVSSLEDDNYRTPAFDLCVAGEESLKTLREAIDCALAVPPEVSRG